MSYNTRRGPQNSTPQQTVGGIGTRRPVVTNNFVSGGQLNPQQQQQKIQQQQQQRAPQQQQQQNTGIQFRNQQQTPTPAQLKQQPITPIKKEPQTPQAVTPQAQQPVPQDVNMSADDSMEGGKKFWKGRTRPQLSKEERTRRRNFRLSKMLQPKNALMILNELVKNVVFSVEDYPNGGPDAQYKAIANCEGIEHTGYGKSKNGAKASAAEAALRHIIKNKSLTSLKQESDSETKMEIEETGEDGKPLPWQQVASFALYKLFCSWGDNPNLITQHVQQSMGLDIPKGEPKPAKKLPDNAAELNPLMLLHQMVPNVHFEEVDKTGVPPNVLFTFRTIVNGTPFSGSGKSKKDARKAVAFEVCQKVFGVQYAPEVLAPAV